MINVKQIKNSNLKLDYDMRIKDYDQSLQIDKRSAVRGISFQNNKILVVYVEKNGLYGTPGGGVEINEELETTLKREMLEETGAEELTIKEYIGKVNEIRPGAFNNKIFNPTMHYYLVDIHKFGPQQLEQYEQDLNLKCAYVDINEVIETNERILKTDDNPYSWFYHFQTELFKILKDLYNL